MLTTVLAIYAAVISTVAVLISYYANKSDNPKLSGTVSLSGVTQGDWKKSKQFELSIALHNRGRGAVTVDSVKVYPNGIFGDGGVWKLGTDELKLPFRIEGNSGIHWDIRPAGEQLRFLQRRSSKKLQAVIGLATGQEIKLKKRKRRL
jgi:hypothetical protein